ncbi:hypothetical protein [Polaribacter cellanae]|uniref:Uncharacterized protein n=1 Tax=Polaribacter cellanae TaxID=2818493 RepID=A0A975CLB7_9FLAO|nr:hypothetical protein [Polaribacter cellanae]QTE21424.1 hypothetical protein J3359_11375 [Polaribacter cellanae]
MKNLFLGLSFLFATFTGGSTEIDNKIAEEDFNDCVNVTLSCGVSGCVYVTSMEMLISHIGYAEAYWCESGRR